LFWVGVWVVCILGLWGWVCVGGRGRVGWGHLLTGKFKRDRHSRSLLKSNSAELFRTETCRGEGVQAKGDRAGQNRRAGVGKEKH